MKTKTLTKIGILAISIFTLQSCMADLRTSTVKKNEISSENITKGKELLTKAWKAQGFDKLKNHTTYSYTGEDSWKGMMGKMGKVWPNSKAKLNFKCEIGTFDSQVTFMDGKRKGTTAGLQNWNYYEKEENSEVKFLKTNKRINFGLAAFQYFSEMIDRLRKAPIIRYAGEKEFKGKKYDLVFCTWYEESPHKKADQYMAWINKETGIMDYTQYTLRDNYLKMPGGQMFYGGIEFSDLKEIDGILIPHKQTVYLNKIKKNQDKHVHQIVISDFKFDSFKLEELKPNKNLEESGDKK